MRIRLLILFVFLTLFGNAQQNKVKLGFIGFPTVSGFGIGNIGYERMQNDQKKSWQILFSISGGSIATDVETHYRKWITVDRMFYFNTIHHKLKYYFSLFSELGTRKSKPGLIRFADTAILEEKKAIEFNPGGALGLSYSIGRKFNLESAVGPKVLFQNGKEYYYNSREKKYYNKSYSNIGFGIRFLFTLSYQF
jgi:hypothetical protein